MDNMEILTTVDKSKRDRMYELLRISGDKLERKVVRFSSMQPVLQEKMSGTVIEKLDGKDRPMYEQTWSVAYPRS